MTREEMLALCRKARDVGAVKHEDFMDYIVVLESRRRVDDEWQHVEHAYMAVDGKLAMANEDHRRQSKQLNFAEPKILLDNAEQLTLLVTVTSEIYGTRHGIATSRKKGGTAAEREFPWEVAETSAIGRALAAMGYGLLPGAGLASAEDMMRASATVAATERAGARRPSTGSGLMTANQRAKLVEMYRERHGGTDAEVLHGLDALFQSAVKHPMSLATFEEASKMFTQLGAQKVERGKK
jgi:hypothetical protein